MQKTEQKRKPFRNRDIKTVKNHIVGMSLFRPNSMETARNYDFIVEEAPTGAVRKKGGENA